MNPKINEPTKSKSTKKPRVKASIRAKTAIANMLAKGGKNKSVAKAMRAAGFSFNYSRNPHKFLATKSIQNEVSNVVERLTELRERAIIVLSNRDLSKDKSRDVIAMVKDFTHDIQLLSGNKTEDYGLEELSQKIGALVKDAKNDIDTTTEESNNRAS